MNKYNEQYRGENADNKDQTTKANAADKSTAAMAKPAADKSTAAMVKPAADIKTAAGAVKSKWPSQVKAAKTQWGKLSEAEILKSDGNAQQLSGLVQQRYNIGRDAADKQVKTFLDTQRQA